MLNKHTMTKKNGETSEMKKNYQIAMDEKRARNIENGTLIC